MLETELVIALGPQAELDSAKSPEPLAASPVTLSKHLWVESSPVACVRSATLSPGASCSPSQHTWAWQAESRPHHQPSDPGPSADQGVRGDRERWETSYGQFKSSLRKLPNSV